MKRPKVEPRPFQVPDKPGSPMFWPRGLAPLRQRIVDFLVLTVFVRRGTPWHYYTRVGHPSSGSRPNTAYTRHKHPSLTALPAVNRLSTFETKRRRPNVPRCFLKGSMAELGEARGVSRLAPSTRRAGSAHL